MRFFLFASFLIASPLIAGIYGGLLDEVSFVISPEFFSKFRLAEYHYSSSDLPWQVAYTGFNNALLIGVLIGFPIALLTLFHKSLVKAVRYGVISYVIIILCTISAGIIGYLSGKYLLTEDVVKWQLPDSITDKVTFLAIETMNNFTYMGGTIGMLIAIYWQMKRKRSDDEKNLSSTNTNNNTINI